MLKINEFISKNLPLLILLMAIFTYLSPYYWKVYPWVPSLLLGIVIFFTGISMDVSSIKAIKTKKRELFIATFLKWTLTVLISIALAHLFFSEKPEIAAGFILSGVVPSATAATLYTFIAGGNTSLVIGASLLDIFVSPVIAPLSMLGLPGNTVSISILSLLKSFVTIVLIPLFTGLVLQRSVPSLVVHSKSITKFGSSISLLLIIHTLVGSGKETISTELGTLPILLIVTFVQVVLPMFLAYFIARKLSINEEDSRAIFFQVGLCNTALAAILAYEFIGNLAAVAPILNMIINLSMGAFFANYFSTKQGPLELSTKNREASK